MTAKLRRQQDDRERQNDARNRVAVRDRFLRGGKKAGDAQHREKKQSASDADSFPAHAPNIWLRTRSFRVRADTFPGPTDLMSPRSVPPPSVAPEINQSTPWWRRLDRGRFRRAASYRWEAQA